ncbi:MAG: tetratricopeptide repeat protein [Deltaproteobacteria bacterium]|nr:tetratricopeptide repeat protein [Deltaproteobacteria bacterium]
MSLDQLARQGLKYLEEGNLQGAIEQFTAALALDSERPDLTNLLGMAYLHRGEVGSAIPVLERSLQLASSYDGPEHQVMRGHFTMGLASAYRQADRAMDAVGLLEAASSQWPEQVELRVQLGQVLFECGLFQQGVETFSALASDPHLEGDLQKAASAIVGSLKLLEESEEPANIFLKAHRDSYAEYFDTVVGEQLQEGWIAEAARMSRGPDGEPRPFIAEGARPWAMTRVDIVNPETNEVYGVYSDTEPMVVAVEGLEPLAESPILIAWKGHPFEVLVSTQCPWHWLTLTVQFSVPGTEDALQRRIDQTLGDWYLAGYNGEFGETHSGRFHDVTDAMAVGDRALSWNVDLGRARYDAIEALLRRLVVLHDTHPLARVILGRGRLPE